MTTARPATIPAVKLTTQLSRGDLLKVDGLGAFAVLHPEPYGSQALIKLGWENLAIIAPRDATWTVTSPADPVRIHGYQPCQACHGTGLLTGNHRHDGLRWDQQARRWRTALLTLQRQPPSPPHGHGNRTHFRFPGLAHPRREHPS